MKQTFDRFFNRCARILAILDFLSSNLSSEGLGKQGFVTGHKMFLHTFRGLRDCVGSKYVYHSKNRISEVFLNDFMCLNFSGQYFRQAVRVISILKFSSDPFSRPLKRLLIDRPLDETDRSCSRMDRPSVACSQVNNTDN